MVVQQVKANWQTDQKPWQDNASRLPPGIENETLHELAEPLIECTPGEFEALAAAVFRAARDEAVGLWFRGEIEWRQIDLAGVRIYLAALRRARAVMIATNLEGGHA